MMWFFRHFWIFISYHIFLLNQVEGAIAIPPSNSAPLPLFCPSVCPSVCPSIGLLTTFSGFCPFADKSLGRNGIELEMQMFPDDLPLANIDADGYCCHFFCFFFSFFFSKVRVGAKEGGSHYWEMAVAITCGYGGYLLPLLAAHSSLSRSSVKFQSHTGWKHADLALIWVFPDGNKVIWPVAAIKSLICLIQCWMVYLKITLEIVANCLKTGDCGCIMQQLTDATSLNSHLENSLFSLVPCNGRVWTATWVARGTKSPVAYSTKQVNPSIAKPASLAKLGLTSLVNQTLGPFY